MRTYPLAKLSALLLFTTLLFPALAAAKPGIVATYDPSQPPPSTVTFQCVTSPFGFGNLSWDFGDGATATGPNASHTYTASGSYSVSCAESNGFGSTTYTTSVSIFENTLLEEDFDDPNTLGQNWGLPADDEAYELVSDGLGGFALLLGDPDNGGGNGQSSGGSSNGPSFPLTSGGGFDELTFYSEGYFRFDLDLHTSTGYIHDREFWLFRLREPNVRLEMRNNAGAWSYRIAWHGLSSAWVALPSNALTSTVEIDFLAGSQVQLGSFEVRWETQTPTQTWNHTSVIALADPGSWAHFDLGVNIGPATSKATPASRAHALKNSFVYSTKVDNFGAYQYEQGWD